MHWLFHVVLALWTGSMGASFLAFHLLSSKAKGRILFWVGSFVLRISTVFMTKTIFVIDYAGGFNLHFETTKEELQELLPEYLQAIPIKTVQGDDERPKYLLSMYCADLELTGKENQVSDKNIGTRSDVFTYVRDREGKMALCFLLALVQYPDEAVGRYILESIMHFFGMDPTNYQVGYPHLATDSVSVSSQHFSLKHKNAVIEVCHSRKGEEDDSAILSENNRLHVDFIKANSSIYRGVNGARNVNFFNQAFIDARVTRWDPTKVIAKNTTDIHPLCKNLVAVEHYGNKEEKIRWYFENS